MPAVAMISTTTKHLTWYCKMRTWTLMASVFNIIVSTIEMFQINFFIDIILDELEDDGTAFTYESYLLNSRVIDIVGMFIYIGIIIINIDFIHEALKRDYTIKYSWLFHYTMVQTLTLFYNILGAFFPIYIISAFGVKHGFKIQLAIIVIFESFVIILLTFFAYMVYYINGGKEKRSKQIFVLGHRADTRPFKLHTPQERV